MKTITINITEIEYLQIKEEQIKSDFKLSNFYKKLLLIGLEKIKDKNKGN